MASVQGLASGFSLDLGPLKEPLGFIRVLEWVFAIFAFATTGGYSGKTNIKVPCEPPSTSHDVTAVFGYPFRLGAHPFEITYCNNSHSTMHLQGDFSSSAEFYVCIGVFGFLYCTATLILYLGYQSVYRQTSRGPIIDSLQCIISLAGHQALLAWWQDLVVTALFAFLWLVSSSAWAKGLTDVKWATNPEHVAKKCQICEAVEFPSMGRLNASVIFGFLNLILWAGNCWFIYKETPFHKDPSQAATMEEGGAPGP